MATQSLYRRYRPRRFGELKGQDHVVRALRDAVAQGREGQAYLFSGPRGTGKTTSARILAKVLNCSNVVDGEPCCACESCLAVERGTSYDVHELDAASNNGVDAIRDLVEKAALGTPGRHKVYILDEVHMLSKAAEAALLKTLEEPPPHVVFVLATTDPQKMSDTIRSRTQHLQFHLLPAEALAEYVRWVADDAGLQLSPAALQAALVQGGGSARDTLSALELLASTGGEPDEVVDLDEFLTALADGDAGRVLTAVAHAVNLGRDPRNVTDEVVRHLRNAFLSLMAPELVLLPADRVDAVAAGAQRLGAARLVRAIERLGSILVEMRHAPDPRILLEVALVQLTNDEVGGDVDALLARVERLERTVKQLGEQRSGGHGAAGGEPAPRDPATGRAVLGGAARRQGGDTSGPIERPTPAAPAARVAAESGSPAGAAPAGASDVAHLWDAVVKPQLKPLVRALYSPASFVGERDGVWQMAMPNDAHAKKCAEHRPAVEQALSAAAGAAVKIEFVVGGDEGGTTPAPTRVERAAPSDPVTPVLDEIDPSDLTDVPPESIKTPIDQLAEAFPGSELVDEN